MIHTNNKLIFLLALILATLIIFGCDQKAPAAEKELTFKDGISQLTTLAQKYPIVNDSNIRKMILTESYFASYLEKKQDYINYKAELQNFKTTLLQYKQTTDTNALNSYTDLLIQQVAIQLAVLEELSQKTIADYRDENNFNSVFCTNPTEINEFDSFGVAEITRVLQLAQDRNTFAKTYPSFASTVAISQNEVYVQKINFDKFLNFTHPEGKNYAKRLCASTIDWNTAATEFQNLASDENMCSKRASIEAIESKLTSLSNEIISIDQSDMADFKKYGITGQELSDAQKSLAQDQIRLQTMTDSFEGIKAACEWK